MAFELLVRYDKGGAFRAVNTLGLRDQLSPLPGIVLIQAGARGS